LRQHQDEFGFLLEDCKLRLDFLRVRSELKTINFTNGSEFKEEEED
jgi:hypothetical protein